MSDIKELTGLVEGELKTIQSDLTEMKQAGLDGTAKFDEKMVAMDKAFVDIDAVKDRMDLLETASKRSDADSEAETKANELEVEFKDAYVDYLRTKNPSNLQELEGKMLEQKLLQVGSDPDGGYLASTDSTGRIVKQVYETSEMRPIATMISTSKKEVDLMVDRDETGATWSGENNYNPDTKTPKVGKITIPVYKMEAEPSITVEMAQDADFDIEAWLNAKVADKFSRTENTAFLLGDGVNKPRGLLTYDSGTSGDGQVERFVTAASGVLDEIDLLSLMDLLKGPYMQGACWLWSRRTNTVLRKIQDADGQFLFGGQNLLSNDFYGYPFKRFEDMDKPTTGVTYAAGALPIAFGNFNEAYTIVDRAGISVLHDPLTSKGLHKYYTTKRVGGDVVNFEAFKVLEIKA
jgi:HK97 family phage major capsid protein